MKWLTRDEWCDRFAEVYDDHLLPACDQTDLDVDESSDYRRRRVHEYGLGLWFEDFLTENSKMAATSSMTI